jgi:hypothetical protein
VPVKVTKTARGDLESSHFYLLGLLLQSAKHRLQGLAQDIKLSLVKALRVDIARNAPSDLQALANKYVDSITVSYERLDDGFNYVIGMPEALARNVIGGAELANIGGQLEYGSTKMPTGYEFRSAFRDSIEQFKKLGIRIRLDASNRAYEPIEPGKVIAGNPEVP